MLILLQGLANHAVFHNMRLQSLGKTFSFAWFPRVLHQNKCTFQFHFPLTCYSSLVCQNCFQNCFPSHNKSFPFLSTSPPYTQDRPGVSPPSRRKQELELARGTYGQHQPWNHSCLWLKKTTGPNSKCFKIYRKITYKNKDNSLVPTNFIKAHLIPRWPHPNELHLQWPDFQTRRQSETQWWICIWESGRTMHGTQDIE